jgi:hypothetical protein
MGRLKIIFSKAMNFDSLFGTSTKDRDLRAKSGGVKKSSSTTTTGTDSSAKSAKYLLSEKHLRLL